MNKTAEAALRNKSFINEMGEHLIYFTHVIEFLNQLPGNIPPQPEKFTSGIEELDNVVKKYLDGKMKFVALISYVWNKGYANGKNEATAVHVKEEGLPVNLKQVHKLSKGDVILWRSGMTGEYEIHTFHSDAGYGAKTFTNYNEKDGSSLLINYSGICGVLIPAPTAPTEEQEAPVTEGSRKEKIDKVLIDLFKELTKGEIISLKNDLIKLTDETPQLEKVVKQFVQNLINQV